MTGSRPAPLPGWEVVPVTVLAVLKVAFQLATAPLYGPHRDEYYYLADGRHLAWGYVDHPPLTPLIYRATERLLGTSTVALHVPAALAGGLLVVLGAGLARELGGGRRAQILTALVAVFGPIYLTTTHFFGTVTLDLVAWAAASWLVLRIVRTGETRLWLAVGAVTGLGLLNKDTMGFWVIGAVAGLTATPERRVIVSRWALLGAAIAAALIAPNLVWQAQHHWPTLEFARHLRANNGASDAVQFIPIQAGIVTIAGTGVVITGLSAALRDPRWRAVRWLAVGFGLLFVLIFASGGKGYYLGSWYLPVVAVGAVVIEQTWTPLAARRRTAAVVMTGVLLAPVFTPILPAHAMAAAGIDNINKDLGGMLGWHHVAVTIAAAVRALPPDEQARTTIFTSNYSEAGVVDYYAATLHLPHAISGHNSYWLWGYGHPADGPVVAVIPGHQLLDRFWGSVVQVGTLGRDGVRIDPQERGVQIYVCRDQRAPWSVIWPAAKHFE